MGKGVSGGLFRGTEGSKKYINQGKQDKHREGSNNYRQEYAKGNRKSILTEDPNALLQEGQGKGYKLGNKEWVDFGRTIGKYYDSKTKTYKDTTKGWIHYDSHGGAHIVPAHPDGDWNQGGNR